MRQNIVVLSVTVVAFSLVLPSAYAQSIQVEPDRSVSLVFSKPFTAVVSVEQSSNLLTWTPAVTWDRIVSQSSVAEVIHSVIRTPLETTKLFFRLRLENAWKAALTWNRSPTQDVVGYCLHYGVSSGNYTQSIDVGDRSTAVVSLPLATKTCYFVVTAYNAIGLQSAPSDQVKVRLRRTDYDATGLQSVLSDEVKVRSRTRRKRSGGSG